MLECKIVIIVTATLNKPHLYWYTHKPAYNKYNPPKSPHLPTPEGLNRGYTEFLPAGVVVGVEIVVEAENKTQKNLMIQI